MKRSFLIDVLIIGLSLLIIIYQPLLLFIFIALIAGYFLGLFRENESFDDKVKRANKIFGFILGSSVGFFVGLSMVIIDLNVGVSGGVIIGSLVGIFLVHKESMLGHPFQLINSDWKSAGGRFGTVVGFFVSIAIGLSIFEEAYTLIWIMFFFFFLIVGTLIGRFVGKLVTPLIGRVMTDNFVHGMKKAPKSKFKIVIRDGFVGMIAGFLVAFCIGFIADVLFSLSNLTDIIIGITFFDFFDVIFASFLMSFVCLFWGIIMSIFAKKEKVTGANIGLLVSFIPGITYVFLLIDNLFSGFALFIISPVIGCIVGDFVGKKIFERFYKDKGLTKIFLDEGEYESILGIPPTACVCIILGEPFLLEGWKRVCWIEDSGLTIISQMNDPKGRLRVSFEKKLDGMGIKGKAREKLLEHKKLDYKGESPYDEKLLNLDLSDEQKIELVRFITLYHPYIWTNLWSYLQNMRRPVEEALGAKGFSGGELTEMTNRKIRYILLDDSLTVKVIDPLIEKLEKSEVEGYEKMIEYYKKMSPSWFLDNVPIKETLGILGIEEAIIQRYVNQILSQEKEMTSLLFTGEVWAFWKELERNKKIDKKMYELIYAYYNAKWMYEFCKRHTNVGVYWVDRSSEERRLGKAGASSIGTSWFLDIELFIWLEKYTFFCDLDDAWMKAASLFVKYLKLGFLIFRQKEFNTISRFTRTIQYPRETYHFVTELLDLIRVPFDVGHNYMVRKEAWAEIGGTPFGFDKPKSLFEMTKGWVVGFYRHFWMEEGEFLYTG
ncbi:MAG: hypothetical protein PHD13_05255 [Methanocellales archaeon]|nr:hypothetical protein [Methanocellales archaeon]MDD3292059.1 hypothetical protein [Methanocellales archaeon]MDD5235560.1 hypothetical protein [Methanocellales archaeon]MDD5485584.1 hypothetical protein [Methanocellales archaeon]